jgi:hypothetical protein
VERDREETELVIGSKLKKVFSLSKSSVVRAVPRHLAGYMWQRSNLGRNIHTGMYRSCETLAKINIARWEGGRGIVQGGDARSIAERTLSRQDPRSMP